MQEFFVAMYVSKMNLEDIEKWLDTTINQEKYHEQILFHSYIPDQ